MFGYIRPVKSECDNYLFKSQYCSLCKALGRKYGNHSRFFISYEIAFFALLLEALRGDKFTYRYENCIIHPFKKRRIKKLDDIDEVCADISVYFLKKKLEDEIKDHKGMKKAFYKLMNSLESKWKKGDFIDEDRITSFFLTLDRLEDAGNDNIDRVSNLFGDIVKETVSIAAKKTHVPVSSDVEEFAFLIGKLIYILDALEDLEKDIQRWNYNPLIFSNKELLLSDINVKELVTQVHKAQSWRIRLLMDHIHYTYSKFRDLLGIYYFEIDGIINKSIPSMALRVLGDDLFKKEGLIDEQRSV